MRKEKAEARMLFGTTWLKHSHVVFLKLPACKIEQVNRQSTQRLSTTLVLATPLRRHDRGVRFHAAVV